MTFLSIIMPVYNEARTICRAVEEVLAVEYPCPTELIVVDDGSTDDTRALLLPYESRGVRLSFHDVNQGKGAAVRTGVDRAQGSHLIIVDADLEYAPRDIAAMLVPVIEGRSDHVFGSRIFGLHTRFHSFRFAVGGRATTLVANVLYDSCLTDMHTCLKLLPVSDFRELGLAENGFGLDTQLTARLLRAGVRPFEIPISYHGRSHAEGKKIGWLDGVRCLAILLTVRFSPKPKLRPVSEVRLAVASETAETTGRQRNLVSVLAGSGQTDAESEAEADQTAPEPVALRR